MALKTSIAIGIVQYLVNMIANAVGKPIWAKWTIFYHANVTEILQGGSYPRESIIYLSLLGLVFVVAGAVIFNGKDISE